MVKPKRNVSFCNEFFKVYLSDFSSRQLSLPPAFGIQFNGKNETLPKNATLKDGNAEIWHVGLVKNEGDWIIKDGWKEFASYYSLVDGDFLIFKYDGSSEFEVELYGKNGLKNERRGLKNRTSIHVKEEEETEEETEVEFIGSGPSSGYKQNDSNIEPRRTRSQGLLGKSGPASSETKVAKLGGHKGVKVPSSVPGKVPRFVMNITRTMRFARIPMTFMRQHNINVPKEMKLRDESGKLWPVQVSFWDSGYTVLTSGFSEFCRMNKLVPRDQCIFTFILAKGNFCNVIQVQVVRQDPRTHKHGTTMKLKA
ncbi:unnamed protein product [Dovyalis caffra]|uniref:TF-B3 domain-containing protein n=1 Tax=Dovyalis caffra TaxID=77055 RepID=A0AAV1RR83_9ROSI|nr:unnamed protein product [Dovyalis caffra]